MTGPTFGDKASGQKPAREYRGPIWERQIAESRKHLRPHGPFICRLCGAMGGEVWISVRNIAGDEPGAGFRSLPCCADRDACRERREMQGKGWPLIDASLPSPWAVVPEKEPESVRTILRGRATDADCALGDPIAIEIDERRGAPLFELPNGMRVSVRVLSTRAEIVLARELGLPWNGRSKVAGGPDVGDYVELHYNTHPSDPVMRIRTNTEHEERPYVCSQSGQDDREFLYLGWAWGWEIMTDEWLNRLGDRYAPLNPCWAYPIARLRSMDTLEDRDSNGPDDD